MLLFPTKRKQVKHDVIMLNAAIQVLELDEEELFYLISHHSPYELALF